MSIYGASFTRRLDRAYRELIRLRSKFLCRSPVCGRCGGMGNLWKKIF